MKYQTCIITGSGALALTFFEKLTEAGWRVALLSKSKPENFSGLFFDCDLTDEQNVKQAVKQAHDELGVLNLAIHTAVSPIIRKRVLDITPKEFNDSFLVDFFGGFLFLQKVSNIMKKQGFGTIVALSSEVVESQVPPQGMAGYVAAKFALKGLLKILYTDLQPYNIAVTALAPGFMDTPLNKDLHPRMIEFIQEQQGGELVTPFLVSEVLLKLLTLPILEFSGKTFLIRSKKDLSMFFSVKF